MMFCYNENTYNGFAAENAPHYDESGEDSAKSAVLRYFEVCTGRDYRSLLITDDNAAYELVTNVSQTCLPSYPKQWNCI